MGKVLIIGAGGVGNVVVHKCAQVPEVFTEIVLASRTLARCEEIRAAINKKYNRDIKVATVDANSVPDLVRLIKEHAPDV
ncbi:MAG: saccharopine dehydrogenase NADP-binding domain-containing protein, partial [Candidatus Paceibacteria bacterium]